MAWWLWAQIAVFGSRREPCDVLRDYPKRLPTSSLPRIIHQQWKDDVPPRMFDEWREAVRKAFPPEKGFEHKLWTDATARELIANDYAWFLPTYDALPQNIIRADASRVFMLHKFGGLYMDLDYEPLEDFWDRLPDDAPGIVEAYKLLDESVQNSMMSSPAKHPFWEYAWGLITERAQSGARVVQIAGPNMIEEAMRRFPGKTHVLACQLWQRVPLGSASANTQWFNVWDRYFFSLLGLVKRCGDVMDMKCHLGIHHSTVTWVG